MGHDGTSSHASDANDPTDHTRGDASPFDFDSERRLADAAAQLAACRHELAVAQAELTSLQSTKIIRYTRLARRVYGSFRRQAARGVPASTPAPAPAVANTPTPPTTPDLDLAYERWVQEFDEMDPAKRGYLDERLSELDSPPLVSVVLPVPGDSEQFPHEAVRSALAQRYRHWELLCVVDEDSSTVTMCSALDECAGADHRIKVVRVASNGRSSATLNAAIDAARGEWLAVIDHDGELSESALALAVLALTGTPDAAILYSDEDRIDENGRRSMPYFKPDFDPVLLLAQNYLRRMTMVRGDLVREAGGFRQTLEGSHEWDLLLRVSERLNAEQVVHVPHVLYHRRVQQGPDSLALDGMEHAAPAAYRTVADHLARQGRQAQLVSDNANGLLWARWPVPSPAPRVSIVIPTRDGEYLGRCLASLFATTAYPDFEVVVMDNGSQQEETQRLLRRYAGAITVVRDNRPFNFSALNNRALAHCSGDVLCLLNDDCEAIDHGWLEEMVGQVLQDRVGVVGAKLLYPDGRVQHAGVVLGMGGVAAHPHELADRLARGYFSWLQTVRTLSAVTAACVVIRRDVYEQLGGLDEVNLAVAFNDVDFCLRAGQAGWRVVWTPHATLIHHGSVSRGHDPVTRPRDFSAEVDYMHRRWGPLLQADPAYNPNLTLTAVDFAPAFPPRLSWWESPGTNLPSSAPLTERTEADPHTNVHGPPGG